MKKTIALTISVILLIFLGSQLVPAAQQKFPGLEQQESFFKTVTPKEAKNLIENRQDLLLIDVRGQDELYEGYIEGSTLIPLWDIIKAPNGLPKTNRSCLSAQLAGAALHWVNSCRKTAGMRFIISRVVSLPGKKKNFR